MDFPQIDLVTTLVSLLVVVFVSLESVYHYREQWKNYRSTEQFISSEYFRFATGDGKYKGKRSDEAFLLFVERMERAIALENASTLSVMTTPAGEDKGGPEKPDKPASRSKAGLRDRAR